MYVGILRQKFHTINSFITTMEIKKFYHYFVKTTFGLSVTNYQHKERRQLGYQVCNFSRHVTNIRSISHRGGIILNAIHGRRHKAPSYFHGRKETQSNKRNWFKWNIHYRINWRMWVWTNPATSLRLINHQKIDYGNSKIRVSTIALKVKCRPDDASLIKRILCTTTSNDNIFRGNGNIHFVSYGLPKYTSSDLYRS